MVVGSGAHASGIGPVVSRYAVAVALVLVATIVRMPLQPLLGDTVPFLLFFPAIAATAWYAGLGAGMLATLLSAVLALSLFAPFSTREASRVTLVLPTALFLGFGVFISGLSEALRVARRRAEEEGRRFATTLLSIGDGVIVTDGDARITLMNGVAEELTGWSMDEARGRPAREVFRMLDVNTREPVADPVDRVLRDGRIIGPVRDRILLDRSGAERPIDDRCGPVRNAMDEIAGTVLVFRDVTERRRAEDEREMALTRERSARLEAEAANRVKDEFLATLSHELRTPLNAILGWSRMLADRSLPDERRQHALAVIQRNAEAQTRLVTDLLDMSRFVTGKARLSFEPVNLAEVVAEAVDAVRVAAEARRIRLTVDVVPAVGPVAGDRDRLRQLVWNLLSNAIKFTPIEGAIVVSVRRSDAGVVLKVADTGIGLEASLIPHVFDRFTQGDASTTRVHGGLGLGLAIVRQIAEAHGGTVRAESAGPGRGSTFTVTLPVFEGEASVPDSLITAGALADLAAPGRRRLDRLRVLVVEDDEDGREVVSTSLETAGAEVRAAGSVAAAIATLATWTPHAVVTDIAMPGQDGFALLIAVRDIHPAMPVIALSGYATASDQRRIADAGFTRQLTKPVDVGVLAQALAEVTSSGSTGSMGSMESG